MMFCTPDFFLYSTCVQAPPQERTDLFRKKMEAGRRVEFLWRRCSQKHQVCAVVFDFHNDNMQKATSATCVPATAVELRR